VSLLTGAAAPSRDQRATGLVWLARTTRCEAGAKARAASPSVSRRSSARWAGCVPTRHSLRCAAATEVARPPRTVSPQRRVTASRCAPTARTVDTWL